MELFNCEIVKLLRVRILTFKIYHTIILPLLSIRRGVQSATVNFYFNFLPTVFWVGGGWMGVRRKGY